MLKRKIDSYLDEFYKRTDKALLVTGARQTGKSFSIRQFGKSHFEHFVEINFIEQPDAAEALKGAKNSQDIIVRLSLLTNIDLVPRKTLIFFDEVQECPEIVTAIKFLVDEGSYRYILSGSLLGIELKDLRSEPVGYMDVKDMYPLDIEEFFQAMGVSEQVMERLRTAYEQKQPVDDFVHKKIMELFRLYLIVGGMPAAVQKYLDTNNLKDVMMEQQAIIRLYKRDISKYDKDHKLYIDEIFDLIPSELNAKNKRFILKDLNENLKFPRYENSFLWLKNAGVALPTYNVEEPVVPLKLSRSRNLFKLFQSDIGLLACQYAEGIQLRIINDEKSINFGSIYENVVAQELNAHGFNLYYFNSKKQGELDFVIEKNGHTLPIEVKSGKDYQRHNALNNVMGNADYEIPQALVFCNENVSIDNNVCYVPIYMVCFLKKETLGDITYAVNIKGIN
ncbi:MAG: ATP-binding protein [Bacteroidaceae bacterium]|nr:ATP-binding protein [Bacteroidaceae bacterium]